MAATRRRYNKAYRDAFVAAVIRNGQPQAVAHELGIPWNTVRNWKKTRPEFAAALEQAIELCGATLVASAIIASRGRLEQLADDPALTPTKIVSQALSYADERWGRKTLDHHLEGDERFARLMEAADGDE